MGDQVYVRVPAVHTGLVILTQLGDRDTSVVIPAYFVTCCCLVWNFVHLFLRRKLLFVTFELTMIYYKGRKRPFQIVKEYNSKFVLWLCL